MLLSPSGVSVRGGRADHQFWETCIVSKALAFVMNLFVLRLAGPVRIPWCLHLCPTASRPATTADLHKLGGLAPVVALLGAASPQLRQGAALVLGTAASNNEAFQEQLLRHHPEAVPALMRLVNSASGGFTPLPPPAPAAASRWGSWWPWGSKPAAAPPAAPAPAAGGSEAGGADDATLAAGSDAAAAGDGSQEDGRREDETAAAAGLYALAAVIRTNTAARAMFYAAGGMQVRGVQSMRALCTNLLH